MISISPEASNALKSLLKEKQAAPESGLRLAVHRGGCAGWQYEMQITTPESSDEIVEQEGVRLIIDAASRDKLNDCLVDYEDSLSDAGFRIRNPQAVRSCGCGTSFETPNEPPPNPDEVEDCGQA